MLRRNFPKSARDSAEAAKKSAEVAQATFENEAKRVKAKAYWTLYGIHENPSDLGRAENYDPSPIRDVLAVYGPTLNQAERSTLNTTLKEIEEMRATVHGGEG